MAEVLQRSKIVTLHRQYGFVEEQTKDPEVKAYLDMAYKAVGSYSKTAGGPAASGMTRAEEQAIMPEITGVYPTDGRKEFADSVNNYFKNFNTKLPPEGLKLEIGLEHPDLPVGYMNKLESGQPDVNGPINLPINPSQYIKWRHAVGHPLCAPDKDTAEKYQHVQWYIQDEDAIVQATTALNKLEDAARKEYFKVIEDKALVIQVLTMLGVPNAKKLDSSTAEISLKGYSTIDETVGEATNEKKLRRFKEVCTDKELAIKYDIMQFIGAGIFEQVGTRILIKESSEQIGINMKETAKWMQDKSNVQLIGAFKAQLEEFGGGKMASAE